jgi:hypothetical protein
MLKSAGRTGTMIVSTDPLLVEAMALIEGAGLIAEGRADEILERQEA